MPITGNYRLIIINGPSDNENCLVSEQEVMLEPKLEAKITECPLWIFDIILWLSICSSLTKYAIMKKIEGVAIFSRSFWNFKKCHFFCFLL